MNIKKRRKQIGVREKLRYTSKKYTMAVRLSNKNIYVLVLCSQTRNVLTQVSTLTPEFKKNSQSVSSNLEIAKKLGKFAAEKFSSKGYKGSFAFDRGDKKYVGKLKAVVDSAVESGLLSEENGD
jgi:ribosomal protein L18